MSTHERRECFWLMVLAGANALAFATTFPREGLIEGFAVGAAIGVATAKGWHWIKRRYGG